MRGPLVAVLALVPSTALGQGYESPQHFALELRVGPYLPDVDSEFDGATPYADTFCYDDKEGCGDLVYSGFEFDWQFLRTDVLSVGVGAGAGFFQAYEKALFEQCPDGAAICPDRDRRSSDYTVLNVIPFTVLGVLRVDVLPRTLRIPLVPYAKAGVDRHMWWVLDGSGTAKHEGVKGSGWTWGWHLAGGLMLLLDDLEPSAARKFDQESGINNSYLFAEIVVAEIDDFGSGEALILSDTTWAAGLALEF